ncbi:MAG: Flp family type IVb pilin [Alphaproteobacteria bacterium]
MTKLSSLKSTLSAFITDESGATIIEYAVLASVLVVGLVVGINALKNKVSGTFSNVGAQL